MLELDLVLERFLGENYAQLTARQQQEFEALLELEDHELWQRVRGEAATASVVERMLRLVKSSHGDSPSPSPLGRGQG
jgi:succinate dehydrogenase flavin-adding protein (antitoxin of CptAB toxin-antitoxin module)